MLQININILISYGKRNVIHINFLGYDYFKFTKDLSNKVNRDLTTIRNSIYKDIKVTAKSLVTQTDIVHLKYYERHLHV